MPTGHYHTEQREALVSYLSAHADRHFTVEALAEGLAAAGVSLSRSTLYRQITALTADGLVRRFEDDRESRFVYQYAGGSSRCDEHFHLKCATCGKLFHVECPRLEEARDHLLADHGFLLGSHRAVLYGECAACAKKGAAR